MTSRHLLHTALAATSLALLLVAGPALAQPADNPGRGQGQGQGASGQERGPQGHPGRGGPHRQESPRDREHQRDAERREGEWRDREREHYRDRDRRDGDWRDRERDRERYRDHDRRDDRYRSAPRIDERELRRHFGERGDWVRPEERASLPPGIRKNLERGKPLPPGIAKRFDDRALRQLPRYEGYEWQRVGPDAVLIDMADQIIYEVVRDLLY